MTRDSTAPLPPVPAMVYDPARLDALASYAILDTPAEAGFDDIVHLIGLFAGEANTGLALAEAHRILRDQDAYWRGLFDRLSEGFLIGEIVRNEHGFMHDWRYVQVNPAWGKLVGIDPASVIGRTIREVMPGIEKEWISDFAGVVETGKSITFTRRAGALDRWYEGRAFKLEGERFGVIFIEVTSRLRADARRSALLELVDRLRDQTAVPEMTRMAAEIVGRTLGITRAGFGRIEGDVEAVEIEPDWTMPGATSIAGRHVFDTFGNIRDDLRQGEPLVISDVTIDPRTSADPSAMQALGIAALVNMPIRKRGRTVAVFIAQSDKPRTWTAEELAFLRNVTDRVEASVARAKAEELQGVLNNELAHRLKNTLAVVQSIATQSLRGVTEQEKVKAFDRRLYALSRAHDMLLQKSWSAVKLRGVMDGVLGMQANLCRFALVGPDMDISAQAALSLSMLLHELATNAVKYGALSSDGGTVQVTWRTDQATAPAIVFEWREHGGPEVTAPHGRSGFGSRLIRMGLLGTRSANLDFTPNGLRAEFSAPLAEFQVQVH